MSAGDVQAKTTVVNKHHGTPFDVYIGRGSVFGNPFPVVGTTREQRAASRRDVIEKYEQYLLSSPDLLARVKGLHGMALQCFCAPAPCHGHVLAHYADSIATTGRLPEQTAFSMNYPSADHNPPIEGDRRMIRPRIVGLAGKMRSGKDTAAEFLGTGAGYRRVAFADAIRQMTLDIDPWIGDGSARALRLSSAVGLVGWERAKAEDEVRRLIQAVGRAVRNQNPEFWLDQVDKQLAGTDLVVVSDVRFPAEVDMIHARGGVVWRVVRPDFDGADASNTDDASEHALDAFELPILTNIGNLATFERIVLETITSCPTATRSHA